MPFSRYVIAPEHIEAMRSAFYKVCDALLLKGEVEDPMTEVIVDKLMALANTGEHDADRLVELVLNDFLDDGLAAPSGKPHATQAPEPIAKSPRTEKRRPVIVPTARSGPPPGSSPGSPDS
jgi:hypothetical protein